VRVSSSRAYLPDVTTLAQRLLALLSEDADDDPTPEERAVRNGSGSVVGHIVWAQNTKYEGVFVPSNVKGLLSSDEYHKVMSAQVVFRPDTGFTAHLGAPVRWVAPNGVLVVYARGQRRSGSAERTGEGTSGTYHDFDASDEYIIPATRNIGPGRRALRAWAQQFMTPTAGVRMQAKQLVRPGD
jgi:hypothetical protein